MEHIVNCFVPQGGKHCVTNSLKQIFSYHGHSYSEEYIGIYLTWDDVAQDMKELSLSGNICLLERMSEKILRLHDEERELFRKLKEVTE